MHRCFDLPTQPSYNLHTMDDMTAVELFVMAEPLVTCAWLQDQWLDKNLSNMTVVDGSYHNESVNRDAEAEYRRAHIDGAVRFDIERICDTSHPMPHMLPSVEQFERDVGKLGISNDSHVIIYDNNATTGMYSAGRVWWMFKVFGHDRVSVLDGGLPKWVAEGRPTVSGEQAQITPTTFKAHYCPHLVRSMKEMIENYHSKKEQVADARSKGRFDGVLPEPRAELHSGHVLNTLNVPYTTVIDPHTKTMKSSAGIKDAFSQAGVDLSRPAVVMCGSGVTAGLVAFAAYLVGTSLPIYDGSWTEWVQEAPNETKHLGVRGVDSETK